jgi:bifunctional non-homologous end joining protein LigD
VAIDLALAGRDIAIILNWRRVSRTIFNSDEESGSWVKVKLTQQQEFVIGGYTSPEGSRKYFGSLLVGYHGPGGLMFAGRVGTGFSERLLVALYDILQKIRRATCPFANLPEKRRDRWGQGITPAVMKRCHWVEPVLVAPYCRKRFLASTRCVQSAG